MVEKWRRKEDRVGRRTIEGVVENKRRKAVTFVAHASLPLGIVRDFIKTTTQPEAGSIASSEGLNHYPL
jgi:hypothetical protein